MARKLLLVPVLVVALFVAVLDAPADPPAGKGWKADSSASWTSPGWTDYKPAGHGDGRRIK